MIASTHNERRLVEHFIDALSELPDVEAGLGQQGDHDQHTHVDLNVAGKSFILNINAKKAVYPRAR